VFLFVFLGSILKPAGSQTIEGDDVLDVFVRGSHEGILWVSKKKKKPRTDRSELTVERLLRTSRLG